MCAFVPHKFQYNDSRIFLFPCEFQRDSLVPRFRIIIRVLDCRLYNTILQLQYQVPHKAQDNTHHLGSISDPSFSKLRGGGDIAHTTKKAASEKYRRHVFMDTLLDGVCTFLNVQKTSVENPSLPCVLLCSSRAEDRSRYL